MVARNCGVDSKQLAETLSLLGISGDKLNKRPNKTLKKTFDSPHRMSTNHHQATTSTAESHLFDQQQQANDQLAAHLNKARHLSTSSPSPLQNTQIQQQQQQINNVQQQQEKLHQQQLIQQQLNQQQIIQQQQQQQQRLQQQQIENRIAQQRQAQNNYDLQTNVPPQNNYGLRSLTVAPQPTSSTSRIKYELNDFNFIKVLGKGSFGKVRFEII